MNNQSPFMSLSQQLFRAFDLVRGSVPTQDYDVILLIASIYKDGIVSNENFSHSPFNVERLLYGKRFDSSIDTEKYSKILPVYENALRRLGSTGIHMLFDLLSSINRSELVDQFPELFDSILYRISESHGKKGGEAVQPKELSKFICQLVDLPENATVYNPFAGLASFNVFFPASTNYFGQELNERTWALGMLRLLAYERNDSAHFEEGDSIRNWPTPNRKFDLIISNPPFGMKMNHQSIGDGGNFRTVEQFLVSRGLQSLADSGKLVLLVSKGFLFRGGAEKNLRKELVERGLLEMLISLPAGLLYNSSIPIVLMVISKGAGSRKSVTHVDAEDYLLSSNTRGRKLDAEKLLYDIRTLEANHDNIVNLGIDAIRVQDYNLQAARYLPLNEVEGIELRKVLSLIKGESKDIPNKGALIRISELKNDELEFEINLSEVKEHDFQRKSIRRVSQRSMLIAMRGSSLKPTWYNFDGREIYLTPDVRAFKVNENLVIPEYLIHELHSEYISQQLDAYRQGVTIPIIRVDDFLKVVIKLPSIEEQRAKVQGMSELSVKLKNLKAERNALAHGRSLTQFDEFASLKHTLGRPRQNILDWADNLIAYVEENSEDFNSLSEGFKEFYDADILSALKEIKRDVNFMTDVLERGEKGLVLSNYSKALVSLSDINKLFNELSSNGYNFSIVLQPLKGKDLNTRGIIGNKVLLRTLVDNILTNAHKYGFDKEDSGNQVVIEFAEVDEKLLIEFRNNGKSFPKNFDREKFITKYSTADHENGSGLGGYDIHRIASFFQDSNWDLILNEDPIFPVKFKFQFPIVMKS